MANIGPFKSWYSLKEAVGVLADKFGEPVTVSDLIDRINEDELPTWFDAARQALAIRQASRNLLLALLTGGR
jgi:hypothetical protein